MTYVSRDTFRAVVLHPIFALPTLHVAANLCTNADTVANFNVFDVVVDSNGMANDLMPND